MNVFLFLVVVGLAAAFGISLSRAKGRTQDNRSRISELTFELGNLRSILLDRIKNLEREVSELRAALKISEQKEGPRAEAPAAAPADAPPVPVSAQPESPAPPPTAQPPTAPRIHPSEPSSEAPPAGVHPEPATGEGEGPPPPVEPSPLTPPGPPGGPAGIDWEQWIGIRGAALLGGIVMAVAALLFLQYSIEHGLIPPPVRVALGFLAGAGSILLSEKLRREYRTTANALAGSGIVILYASIWAARILYDLIGSGLGFAFMILVTAACGLLSWRHHARDIALLGLIGGFATPLLLSTGQDNPIGLFAYILLLDVGLVSLARYRRWPVLMVLSLAGTVFYQFAWIFVRMGPERTLLGLGILAVFGLFYAIAGRLSLGGEQDEHERQTWRTTQVAAVLLPFAFALYFAGNAELGPHLYPVGALLLLLSIVAGWLSRVQNFPLLSAGAASGSVAVVLVWLLRAERTTASAWEAVGVCLALALAYHVFLEWDWYRSREQRPSEVSPGTLITAGGFFVLLIAAPLWAVSASFWPWFCGWLGLAGLLVRQSDVAGEEYRQGLAALGLGLGFSLFFVAHRESSEFPAAAVYFALVLAVAVAFQTLALSRKDAKAQRWANIASAVFAATVLVFLWSEAADPSVAPVLYLATTILLAGLVALAATRLPSGGWYFAGMLLLALGHFMWTSEYPALRAAPDTALQAFAFQALAVVLFSWWPFLARTSLAGEQWAWRAAALAGPAWFLSLKRLFEIRFGSEAIALLPIALAALSLGAAFRARQQGLLDTAMRKRGLVWFSAAAMGFLSIAIPLQLEEEWITLGWALQGLALTALWKRLDHAGLKYFGLTLLAVVTVRLVANPWILDYHPSSSVPIFNWLMYTYLIPAAALLGSAWNLYKLELERLLEWEEPIYALAWYPLGAISCSLAATLVVFVWINLTIFDFFSTGSQLTISLEHMAARDLTLSLAWAVYALLLLGIGVSRNSVGLRWVSLGFLVLTIGKVFLHDLGELEDLYRVGSLVGLAFSLIAVSLAYQRFVFRKSSSEGD